MLVRILGSGAGGGFPQWNCNCSNCAGYRQGTIRAHARTQSSIAISPDGSKWMLGNASPDIRSQLAEFTAVHPRGAVRDCGIEAVVLIDSQLDHVTGLLSLRESHKPLKVYCTERTHEDLVSGFPLFSILEHYCRIDWQPVPVDETWMALDGIDGLSLVAIPLTSKPPPYSPHRQDTRPGDNIALLVKDDESGRTLFFAPGLGLMEQHLEAWMSDADCLLVDGTFWTDDEMQRQGAGQKRATEMGHLALSGPDGLIEQISRFSKPRKVLIHINNTNPILDEDSPQRSLLADKGIEVSFDGMEIEI